MKKQVAYSILLALLLSVPLVGLSENDGDASSQQMIRQKFDLLERLLGNSFAGVDIPDAAKNALSKSQLSLKDAENYLAEGEYTQAEMLIDEGLRQLATVSTKVNENRQRVFDKEEYQVTIERLTSYRAILEEIGVLDEDYFLKNYQKAVSLFENGATTESYRLLSELSQWAEGQVIKARENQTLVYSLTFLSPKEEWEYELKRNENYFNFLMLHTRTNPFPDAAVGYAKELIKKNDEYKKKAIKAARKEKYEEAVGLIESGTDNLARLLRMSGVPIP